MGNKNKSCPVKKTSIGGQALMEGIMMRGPEITAMAVRNPEGEIVIEKFPTETKKRSKFFKLPIIRGVFNYVDSMVLGTKCLMRSAEISGLEEADAEYQKEKAAKKAKKDAKKAAKKRIELTDSHVDQPQENNSAVTESEREENGATQSDDKKDSSMMMTAVMVISVILGIALSIGLFFLLPTFIYGGITALFPALVHKDPAVNSLIQSVIEGILKLIIIIGYMSLMTLMKDIRRTFQFHGAEHKAIFCYEAGLELTVENVRKQRRFHPRCGTSFLILMILVSIFISFFINPLFYLIFGFVPGTLVRALIKLLLIPLIVGIGYELIKIAGKYDNLFTRIISAPGVWLQHITTIEPDDSMIECAIVSLNEVIPENGSDNW